MKEHGGCRAWDFGDQHIQKRAVELGLEEYDEGEPSKRVRRVRKQTTRRAAASNNDDDPWAHNHNNHNGYANAGTIRTLTAEQEEAILRHFPCKPEPESPEPSLMMPPPGSNAGSPHQQQQQQQLQGGDAASAERDQQAHADSARVARRACEQVFSKAGGPIYPGLSNNSRHPMPS